MVLQLPVRPFPMDSGLRGMGPYVQFRPYLVSKHLRWSYPPLSNEQAGYQRRLMHMTGPEIVATAHRDGFAAILINRAGYPDQGASLMDEMNPLLAGNALLLQTEDYIALDIRKPDAAALSKASVQAGPCSVPATYHIDRLSSGTVDEPFVVAGWAVDLQAGKLARRVDIVADGERFFTNYGLPRPDIASNYGNPALLNAGFDLVVPGGTLRSGDHTLKIRVLSADGSCYQEGAPVAFKVR
jgi:hypothetical protein